MPPRGVVAGPLATRLHQAQRIAQFGCASHTAAGQRVVSPCASRSDVAPPRPRIALAVNLAGVALDVADGDRGGEIAWRVAEFVSGTAVRLQIADGHAGHGVPAPVRRPAGPRSGEGVIEIDATALVDREIGMAAAVRAA